jgi:predicted ATPase
VAVRINASGVSIRGTTPANGITISRWTTARCDGHTMRRMARGQLLSIDIERFKSYRDASRVDVAPLTVLVGRNNAGKSTPIQALLLLQQTLELSRSDVPLRLDGTVHATRLRDLIWRRDESTMPTIGLELFSSVNVRRAIESHHITEKTELVKHLGFDFDRTAEELRVVLDVRFVFGEADGQTELEGVSILASLSESAGTFAFFIFRQQREWALEVSHWNEASSLRDRRTVHLAVEFDHFIPYVGPRRGDTSIPGRSWERAAYAAWGLLCAQPLEDLREILQRFTYLSSTRSAAQLLHQPQSVIPDRVGVSGEAAAELLHRRKSDQVHYPVFDDADTLTTFPRVAQSSLEGGVNTVLEQLGVRGRFETQDVGGIAFQVLFGGAPLPHVGRGLSYLLPIVVSGLLSDPLRFSENGGAMSRDEYLARLPRFTHGAYEEPEAHVHPRVQARLARWFVGLAMTGRRLIVETHSDHLVRHLRKLVATAPKGGEIERWLLDNVAVLHVTQDEDGASKIQRSKLTQQGSFDKWPADFMDAAVDDELAITDAEFEKRPRPPRTAREVPDEPPKATK